MSMAQVQEEVPSPLAGEEGARDHRGVHGVRDAVDLLRQTRPRHVAGVHLGARYPAH